MQFNPESECGGSIGSKCAWVAFTKFPLFTYKLARHLSLVADDSDASFLLLDKGRRWLVSELPLELADLNATAAALPPGCMPLREVQGNLSFPPEHN